MVVPAETSNKLIRIRGFRVDYVDHAHSASVKPDSERYDQRNAPPAAGPETGRRHGKAQQDDRSADRPDDHVDQTQADGSTATAINPAKPADACLDPRQPQP